MSVLAHIDVLEKKHAQLEKELQNATNHHVADTEVTRLKKAKLRIKDEIANLIGRRASNENVPQT